MATWRTNAADLVEAVQRAVETTRPMTGARGVTRCMRASGMTGRPGTPSLGLAWADWGEGAALVGRLMGALLGGGRAFAQVGCGSAAYLDASHNLDTGGHANLFRFRNLTGT